MTIAETNLENAKTLFFAHREKCDHCRQFVLHRTGTLSKMCLRGTQLYKDLLSAEDQIVKHHKALERAREARLERRELMKQMRE